MCKEAATISRIPPFPGLEPLRCWIAPEVALVHLELVLQICVGALCALGTLLMGLGERSAFLPFAAIVVAILSVYLTDYLKVIRLHSTVANLAGLVAVIVSLTSSFRDFRQYGNDAEGGLPDAVVWLMAVAHLLSYLQFVLLFQQKNDRTYWLLLTLSLLQVAVAAALSLEVWFGLLLALYLFLAAITMCLFFLVREQQRYEIGPAVAPRRVPRSSWVRRRWPLAGRPSQLKSSVQLDPAYGALSWSFLRRVGGMVVVTVLLTCLLFTLVPRMGQAHNTWGKPRGIDSLAMTGFASEVEINQLGEMLESPEKVMRVRFEDPETGASLQIAGEPALRGSVLTSYQNGKWTRAPVALDPSRLRQRPPSGVTYIKQVIDLEPVDTEVLFGTYPWGAARQREDLLMQVAGPTLERIAERRMHRLYSEFHYEILTWGASVNAPVRTYPHYMYWQEEEVGGELGGIGPRQCKETYLHRDKWEGLRQLPMRWGRPVLSRMSQLAAEIAPGERFLSLNYETLPQAEVIARAEALERYLRDSGEFAYSLSARRQDLTIDPIEDFLFNIKEGHCEYFASALTLMLRSRGIPARMISGFKGGEWNPIGEFYQVRQYHAHTWVEAYIPSADGDPEKGLWLVLDATPGGGRDEVVKLQDSQFTPFSAMMDYAQYLWSGYVLGMDPDRQQQSVYEPITKGVTDLVTWLFDREAWGQFFTEFARIFTTLDWSYFTTGQWFSWRSGLVTVLLLWTLVGFWKVGRWLLGRWLGWKGGSAGVHQENGAASIEFYHRLEDLLAKARLTRLPGQTPREFAVEAGGRLADQPDRQPLAAIPRRIVEVYYRVRYGGAVLDSQEALAVEQALLDLESRLNPDPSVDRSTAKTT
jgi:hypothetical protein